MALPFELVDEILCRLPVKYLLRYRCVSKEWCSLIDSASFFRKHLNRNIECNATGIIINGEDNFFSVDTESLFADEDVLVTEINDPLKTVFSRADFVGAANCLVCLSENGWTEFILFNPSTRKYRKIANMPCEFACLFDSVKDSQCGFGYDHVHDDYKVVRIAQLRTSILVMVYSLNSNSWTQIQNVPNDIYLTSQLGMFTSGALHWFAVKDLRGFSYIIVAFDLGLEQFKEVPSPVGNGAFYFAEGGSLCILDKCTKFRTDVWQINNYGAENPWYKAFSVEQPGVLGSFRFFRPVANSRSGKDVLLEMDSTKLVWYDPERKVVKNIRIHGIPIRFGSHPYRESLLQLTNNDQLQKPSEGKKEKKVKKQPKKRDDFLSEGFKLKL